MTLEQMAGALDVRPMKLRPLLYALVVAGLVELAAGRLESPWSRYVS